MSEVVNVEEPPQQQFCLRWNNFQANITAEFEALRDDEDFTDVTLACDGQRILAHKIVLSACSPYFKELFKANPCSHPIVFMRDVEANVANALIVFMYTGEVNVAQTYLPSFLKTAESLKIRGLTEGGGDALITAKSNNLIDDDDLNNSNLAILKQRLQQLSGAPTPSSPSCGSNTVSSHCESTTCDEDTSTTTLPVPPPKRLCKPDDVPPPTVSTPMTTDGGGTLLCPTVPQQYEPQPPSTGELCQQHHHHHHHHQEMAQVVRPKIELRDYLQEERHSDGAIFYATDVTDLRAEMELLQPISGATHYQPSNSSKEDIAQASSNGGGDPRKLHSLDPRPCRECGRVYSNLSNLRQHMKLIHYPTLVQCPVCKKTFKNDLYLRRHLMSSHDHHRINNSTNNHYPHHHHHHQHPSFLSPSNTCHTNVKLVSNRTVVINSQDPNSTNPTQSDKIDSKDTSQTTTTNSTPQPTIYSLELQSAL